MAEAMRDSLQIEEEKPAAEQSGHSRSSISAASVNLTKNLIGAGIFTLPMSLLYGSLSLGLGVMLLACMVQGSSFVMIAWLCQQLKCSSYSAIMACTFGRRAGSLVDICICTNIFFSCVSYNILVADFSLKALEGLFGITGFPRTMLIWGSTLLITMPLSHARNLSPLRYTSLLGLAIIAFVILYVVGNFIFEFPTAAGNLKANAFHSDIGIFSTLALCTGAFQAHYNSPKFFRELGYDLGDHITVVRNSFGMAFLIYSSFAVAGLGLFGSDLLGNVLKNFPAEGNVPVLMSWLGMAFAILFTYPLAFTTGRDSFISLVPAMQRAAAAKPKTTHILCTSLPVALIATVACMVTDVSVVVGMVGATIGSSLCWIFPACIYLKVTSSSTSQVRDLKLKLPESKQDISNPGGGRHCEGSPRVRAYACAMVAVGFSSMAIGLSKTVGLL